MARTPRRSLDFARDCGYLSEEEHAELVELSREVGRMLGAMMNNPQPFLISNSCPPTSGL